MKYSVPIFLALIFTIIPLYESNAASVDDVLGRTYLEIEPLYSHRLLYEDNIDGDPSGKDRISDWSNQYRPEILLTAYSPYVSLSSSAQLRIVEYINERDYNYVDQDYTFGLGYLPNSRTEFSLDAGYSINTDLYRIDDGGGVDLGSKTTRYKDKKWEFGSGFSYELSPRSLIGLSGFYSDFETRNSDDTQFWGVIASYTRILSARTNAIVDASYFYYDFAGNQRKIDQDDPFTFYSFIDQTLKNYTLKAGIEHNFANESSFFISGGVRYTDQDSNTTNGAPIQAKNSGNGQGWILDIQWTRKWAQWAQVFEASNDITVDPEGTTYEATSFLSRTTYFFNQRLSASLYMQFKRAEGDGDEFLFNRDSDFYSIQPSVKYQLYRWLTANMGYQYRYAEYKQDNDRTVHSNLFFIDLTFRPLRNLVVR